MTIGQTVGIILLLWLSYDLLKGEVYLHRRYRRTEKPAAYWLTMLVWLVVAISCFFWW